jgi:hypothetical protein
VRLSAIYNLKGYTGPLPTNSAASGPMSQTEGEVARADLDGDDLLGAGEDDLLRDEVDRLTEYLDNITL